MNKNQNDLDKREIINFGYYMVAFLDILGQRQILRALQDLPANKEERELFITKIKQSYGVVEGIRKWFTDIYDEFNDASEQMKDLPGEYQKLYEDLRKSTLKFQTFSDAVIMYQSLADNDKYIPLNSIFAAFVASGSTMLTSLIASHPLRGGIEIGIGGEIFEKEIYGSCLINAYDLESTVAQYPRIVVGHQMISYLHDKIKQGSNTFREKYEIFLASKCWDLLYHDCDGVVIIDYLGKGFNDLMQKAGIGKDEILKALNFVEG